MCAYCKSTGKEKKNTRWLWTKSISGLSNGSIKNQNTWNTIEEIFLNLLEIYLCHEILIPFRWGVFLTLAHHRFPKLWGIESTQQFGPILILTIVSWAAPCWGWCVDQSILATVCHTYMHAGHVGSGSSFSALHYSGHFEMLPYWNLLHRCNLFYTFLFSGETSTYSLELTYIKANTKSSETPFNFFSPSEWRWFNDLLILCAFQ